MNQKEKEIEKRTGMTFTQRTSFIAAGMDPVYSEHPDPKTETIPYMLYVRKQIQWVNDNILHYPEDTTLDSKISLEATKIINLTIRGEKEAEKNS